MAIPNVNGTTTGTPSTATELRCSDSLGCLFATELGEFKTWHLVLITAVIISIALAVVCKVIPCKRWPSARKASVNQIPTNDLTLEDFDTTANQDAERLNMNSQMLDGLPPTGGYGGVAIPRMGQQYSDHYTMNSYTIPEEVKYETQDHINERSVDKPWKKTVTVEEVDRQEDQEDQENQENQENQEPQEPQENQEDQEDQEDQEQKSIVAKSFFLPTPQTTEFVTMNEGSLLDEQQPRKSSFRKNSKKRHSYHFEKPHVSFQLEAMSEQGASRQFQDISDSVLAPLFLSEEQYDVVPTLPAPVPPYQRYGSLQGFPYISPSSTGGRGGHKVSSASGPPTLSVSELRSSTQV